MKRSLAGFAVLAMALSLMSCTGSWSPDDGPTGYVSIRIAPQLPSPQAIGTKDIPDDAESLRFRIWKPGTQYNDVFTVDLQTQAVTLAIEIPEGDNYVLDAVSYQFVGYPVALTGDRATGIDIAADEVTNVTLVLAPWDVDITGPDEVAPEAEYSLTFAPEDAGGLLSSDTFDTASLRVSENDFSDPALPLPAIAGQAVHSDLGSVTLTADAPAAAVETTLYALALIQFTQDWFDYTLANPAERSLFLELPNRHMDEDLHEFLVQPSVGGVEVDVSGVD